MTKDKAKPELVARRNFVTPRGDCVSVLDVTEASGLWHQHVTLRHPRSPADVAFSRDAVLDRAARSGK